MDSDGSGEWDLGNGRQIFSSVSDHHSGSIVGCYGDVTRAWIPYRALARSAEKIVGPWVAIQGMSRYP
jgi:hypothetical protein